jgi:hypothetical protein
MDSNETDRSVEKANQKDKNRVRGKAWQKLQTMTYVYNHLNVEFSFA